MKTISREIVGAILVSKDQKVLLGKTAMVANGVYSGNWVIPGGGIDEGETREQALIREMREETNHDISGLHIELIDDTATGESEKTLKDTGEKVLVKMNFYEYRVQFDKTAAELGVNPTEELVELQWFDANELSSASLAEPTRKLFQKVGMIY